jgi:hypothetical protein
MILNRFSILGKIGGAARSPAPLGAEEMAP